MAVFVLNACVFAAEKHKYQKRKSDGSPFINHPLGVASLVNEIGDVFDINILAAAVLHDTLEDTKTTLDELKAEFGDDVARIVSEVTDDKSAPKTQRKKDQVAHAPHISREARLVKLADKLYNLRDLRQAPPPGWTVERVQGYFVWAKAVVQGMRGTNKALEDALDDVFESYFEFEAVQYRCCPDGDLETQLAQYYDLMSNIEN